MFTFRTIEVSKQSRLSRTYGKNRVYLELCMYRDRTSRSRPIPGLGETTFVHFSTHLTKKVHFRLQFELLKKI
jgi:hypothetical protein